MQLDCGVLSSQKTSSCITRIGWPVTGVFDHVDRNHDDLASEVDHLRSYGVVGSVPIVDPWRKTESPRPRKQKARYQFHAAQYRTGYLVVLCLNLGFL
jgi:hypothetical protein